MMARPTPAVESIRAAATPAVESLYAIRLTDGQLRLALSTQDVADLTGMPVTKVRELARDGELESTGGERYRLISVQALLRYLGLLPDAQALGRDQATGRGAAA